MFKLPDADALVPGRAEASLGTTVISGPAFAIHRDSNSCMLRQFQVIFICKVRTRAAVHDRDANTSLAAACSGLASGGRLWAHFIDPAHPVGRSLHAEFCIILGGNDILKNKATGIYLLISHILFALALPYWLVAGLMSIMMFDSGESPGLWTTFFIIWSFPLFVLAAVIISWLLYHKRKFKAAGWWNLLPFLWPVAVLASFSTV